jgi:hypothetical protein
MVLAHIREVRGKGRSHRRAGRPRSSCVRRCGIHRDVCQEPAQADDCGAKRSRERSKSKLSLRASLCVARGYLGLTIGWVEGFELNFLGAVVGFGIRRPALKFPGIGRLGMTAGVQARNRRSIVMETLAPTEGLTLAGDLCEILIIECIPPFKVTTFSQWHPVHPAGEIESLIWTVLSVHCA